MTARLRAVLFDYGHTIVDFQIAEEALLTCYDEVRSILAARAYRELPAAHEMVERLTRQVGRMVQQSYVDRELEELDIVVLFDRALRVMGLQLPRELIRLIAEMEHRAMVSRLEALPENLEVLRHLREEGFRLGVVSNAHFLPELMREDFDRLGISQYLDGSVVSAEIGVRKPHPAIFRKVLKEVDVEPGEAIFVGDRLRDDISGAQALGMRGVLTHQFRQEEIDPHVAVPDRVIDRLVDLLPYVEAVRNEGAA